MYKWATKAPDLKNRGFVWILCTKPKNAVIKIPSLLLASLRHGRDEQLSTYLKVCDVLLPTLLDMLELVTELGVSTSFFPPGTHPGCGKHGFNICLGLIPGECPKYQGISYSGVVIEWRKSPFLLLKLFHCLWNN